MAINLIQDYKLLTISNSCYDNPVACIEIVQRINCDVQKVIFEFYVVVIEQWLAVT